MSQENPREKLKEHAKKEAKDILDAFLRKLESIKEEKIRENPLVENTRKENKEDGKKNQNKQGETNFSDDFIDAVHRKKDRFVKTDEKQR